MGLILLWDRDVIKSYPQTILAACQSVTERSDLTPSAFLHTKTRISLEASYIWPQAFLSPQTAFKKALFHPFYYLFQSSSQNPGSFFKNHPQTGFHIVSKSQILEVCKNVFRNKFKYFKFILKRDYIPKYTLLIIRTLMLTF